MQTIALLRKEYYVIFTQSVMYQHTGKDTD